LNAAPNRAAAQQAAAEEYKSKLLKAKEFIHAFQLKSSDCLGGL
jgi:hypothetical protein